MNVQTITMSKHEARARQRSYRDGLRRRVSEEWQQAEKAYRELANGRPLLSMQKVLELAPVDEKQRLRVAIARADQQQVRATFGQLRRTVVQYDAHFNSWGPSSGTLTLAFDTPRVWEQWREGYALVPMVPPEVKRHHDLSKHFVLWEVEEWSDRRLSARPDRDPLLLRRISADLFAVVAEWELTPVEQAIMASRLQ